MKPVNIQNLENILTRIWSGELEHNQTEFFCGTSCCLAGWDFVLNGGFDVEPKDRQRTWEKPNFHDKYRDPWAWSREYNNLSYDESRLLFYARSTRDLHELVLKAFKAGKRLNDCTFNFHVSKGFDYNNYPIVIEAYDLKTYDKLTRFLGESDTVEVRRVM